MQCPQCGNEVKPTALYCQRCGRRLVEKPEASGARPPNPHALPANPPAAPGVHDTQPVAPVPPTLSADAMDQVIAAETRELSFDTLQPTARPSHIPLLAPGSLIGGHYRVERLLVPDPEGPLYEVFDLWAQERCWACGTLWNDGDDDQYCAKCGAERHGKALFLRPQPLRQEMFTEAATVAPNAIIDGELMYLIVPEEDIADVLAAAPPMAPPQPLPIEEGEVSHSPPLPGSEATAGNQTMVTPLDPALFPPIEPREPEGEAAASGLFDPPTVEARFFEMTALLPNFSPRWEIRLGVMSDVGQSRRGRPNEDTTVALHLTFAGDDIPPPLTIGVVADGLGGHDNGQRAGRLAARIIARHVLQQLWVPSLAGEQVAAKDPGELGAVLRAAILDANAQILKINRSEDGDMGCTVTAFIAQGDAACVANVGDSRTYFFDGHELSRVTTDHSLVARLVAAGMLLPDEVYTHPNRSQIYRSLGDEGDLQVDLFPRRLRVGETLVLCSDGLWEMVRDPEMAHLLSHALLGDPQALAQQLVEMANANGGDDNVSVLVAQVVA